MNKANVITLILALTLFGVTPAYAGNIFSLDLGKFAEDMKDLKKATGSLAGVTRNTTKVMRGTGETILETYQTVDILVSAEYRTTECVEGGPTEDGKIVGKTKGACELSRTGPGNQLPKHK